MTDFYAYRNKEWNTGIKVLFSSLGADIDGNTCPDSFTSAPGVFIDNGYGKDVNNKIIPANDIYVDSSLTTTTSFTIKVKMANLSSVHNYYDFRIEK